MIKVPNRQSSNRNVRRERKTHEQSYTRPKPPARVRPVTPQVTPPKSPEQPVPEQPVPEQPAPEQPAPQAPSPKPTEPKPEK